MLWKTLKNDGYPPKNTECFVWRYGWDAPMLAASYENPEGVFGFANEGGGFYGKDAITHWMAIEFPAPPEITGTPAQPEGKEAD